MGLLSNRITIYVMRRLLVMVPMFLGISILTFVMVRATGSPEDLVLPPGTNHDKTRAIIRRQYGLDEPYYKQYLIWLDNFFSWEFGYSGLFNSQNPSKNINELIYQTAKLQYIALFLSILISIPLGVKAARSRGKPADTIVSALALLGLSMPIYVSGFLLILIFGGGGLNWFPVKGAYEPFRREFRKEVTWDTLIHDFGEQMTLLGSNIQDTTEHMFLPLIAITFSSLALITRLVRSNMLEVLGQDFIFSARANGLDERAIIWKHALRNAIIPVITFIGLAVGGALAGAPITETVFTWPGLGIYYVSAIRMIDMSLILGITMILTILILLSNLITDIVYAVIDPRVTI
ncbi:MAG: ABC transporter permease [Candidatus Kariarchaeaceae archaeon]